jgi:selenocysteine-specific elongation factor
MKVTFHCHADEANAQLRLLEAGDLRQGETSWAQIKLETPVAVERGDRFVLRTPNDTIAGGVIADTTPKRHRRGDAAVIASLEALLSESPRDLVLAAVGRTPFIAITRIATEIGRSPAEAAMACADLEQAADIVVIGEGDARRAVLPARLAAVASDAVAALDAYHREHPLRMGMPQEEFRKRLGLDAATFGLVADRVARVRITGPTAALAGFHRAPTIAQQGQIDAWLSSLRTSPGGNDVTLDPALLAYLVETGAVVDTGGGIVFEAAAFDAMTAQVRAHIEQHGTITLAQARDLFGTSRKYAQALLEQLDRLRVTRRNGDERTLW